MIENSRPSVARPRGTRVAVRALLAIGLTLSGGLALAETEEAAVDRLRFSGFGTIGLVNADAPEGWGYRRDIGQPGSTRRTRADVDSRLGLQFNYQALPEIELVGQALLTRLAPYANTSDIVQSAFLAYRPHPEWALRVGRVSVDAYLVSDYRNVGFAYSAVRPPVEFYGLIPGAVDGADVTRSWNAGDAQWRVKCFAGRLYYGDLSVDDRTTIDPIYGLIVTREADGLLLRASVSRYLIKNLPPVMQTLDNALAAVSGPAFSSIADEVARLRQRIDIGGVPLTYATLAADYDWNDWRFTAEGERVYGHSLTRVEAGYFRVARRFGPVTGYGGYSRITALSERVATPDWATRLAPVLGSAGAQQVQALGTISVNAINDAAPRQHTWSLGARWDVQPQLALKFQWDRVDTDQDGGVLWANPTNRSARSNVLSAALDFVF